MASLDFDNIGRLLPKLEALYPEHKVFALSSLDDDLREQLNLIYQALGFNNLNELLEAIGYRMISGSEVRDLRSEVIYSPGSEPEPIRTKVKNMQALLAQYYPDRIIRGSMQNDHKSLYSKVSGLQMWLGYENAEDFLEAYGYQYRSSNGRPENDYQGLVEALLEKYAGGPKPKNMGILIFENPEYRSQIKTLQNKAPELFGMSLKAFFTELGIFEGKEEAVSGTAARPAAGGVSRQDAGMAALRELYASLDPAVHGTYENAAAKLEGIVIKQNKAGKIYVFRANRCPADLVLPYGIDLIGKEAFKGETGLRSLVLPASLTEIYEEAFAGCTSLGEIRFSEGLAKIGNRTFRDCTSLKAAELPASLQELGKGAFAGCTALADVVSRNPVLMTAEDSFEGCPYRFEAVSDEAGTPAELFDWSEGKKGTAVITGYRGTDSTVRIPSVIEGRTVTTLGTSLFQGNPVPTEIYVPDTVTVLQKDVFRDCPNLETLRLSDSIAKITTTMFSGCYSLKKINIPDSVSELKKGTFRDSPLRDLHIGKALSDIAPETFGIAENDPASGSWWVRRTVENTDVDPANPHFRAEGGCLYSRDGKELVMALRDSRSISIPEGTETIAAGAFENMKDLADVSFPDSLVSVGADAFSNTGLRSIRIGRNMRKIGNNAFSYCRMLSSVIFEEGVEAIGDGAFDGCPIVSVMLPATVRQLGTRSFSCFGGYSDRMMEFRIADGNPFLRADGKALYHLDGQEKTLSVLYAREFRDYSESELEYTVQPGTTRIADEACAQCRNLKKVALPEGLLSIGERAFAGTGVSSLDIPASLQQIGEAAFAASEGWDGRFGGLDEVHIAEGNAAFFIQDKTLYMKLPGGGYELLFYFGGGEAAAVPDGTVKIGREAFAYRSVTEAALPASLREIGEAAFKGCTELSRIRIGITDSAGHAKTGVIYLPQAEVSGMYWGESLRDQFMDCIRTGMDGALFDFEKYDSLFASISSRADKVLVAVDRLKSAVELDPVYAQSYREYLTEDPDLAARTVITYDDADGLELLGELDCIDEYRIDRYIDLANKAGKTGAQLFLMNYKNEKFGFDDSEFEL